MNKTYTYITISLIIAGCSSNGTVDYNNNIKDTIEKLNIEEMEVSSNKLVDLIDNNLLKNIIDLGLKKSPDMNNAELNLKIAQLNRNKEVGENLPNVNSNFKSNKTEGNKVSYQTDVTVSWELDLWNKISLANKLSDQYLEYSNYEYENVKSILIADIIRNWTDLNLYNKYIKIEEEKLKSLEKSHQFVIQRYSKGIGNLTDVDSIEKNIYTVKSNIEKYVYSKNESTRSLNVLIGSDDLSLYEVDDFNLINVFYPLDYSTKQNLQHRPDLKMAYKTIEMKDLSTRIAYKDMLPSFSLSASLSDSASNPIDSLLVSPIWNLLGQITMPLFNGSSLKNKAKISEMETEQAYWTYQKTLLNAVKEVNDYTELEKSLSIRENYLEKSLKLSKTIEKRDGDKYSKGLINISDYLSSQRSVYDFENQLATVKQERIKNRINLGLSLGLGA